MSLENVLLDVRELGKGMDLIRRECSLHDHSVLKGFIQTSDTQLDKLQKDAKTAEVSQPCPFNLKGKKKQRKNRHEANFCSRCSSLTSSTPPIMTLNSTVFTYIASTLALSSFPILGSFQQCGELLWRECQDDSTLRVLPCVRALRQGLQGEDTKQMTPLSCFPDRVQLSVPVRGEVPWFQIWMLSVSEC